MECVYQEVPKVDHCGGIADGIEGGIWGGTEDCVSANASSLLFSLDASC